MVPNALKLFRYIRLKRVRVCVMLKELSVDGSANKRRHKMNTLAILHGYLYKVMSEHQLDRQTDRRGKRQAC